MSFDPYIHFQGNARAALTAYQALFGGRLDIMPYAAAPGADPDAPGGDRVMHGTLTLPDGRCLMASDFPPGFEGDPQKAVSISHGTDSVERARTVFDALAEGGAVVADFGPSFFSDAFGMVKDRFGTHWIITGPIRG